jgi:hypothetical protein
MKVLSITSILLLGWSLFLISGNKHPFSCKSEGDPFERINTDDKLEAEKNTNLEFKNLPQAQEMGCYLIKTYDFEALKKWFDINALTSSILQDVPKSKLKKISNLIVAGNQLRFYLENPNEQQKTKQFENLEHLNELFTELNNHEDIFTKIKKCIETK